ncbi:MAG TPA: hypothetical protein VFA98_07875 [Thermoanaerobaculia bacterium]|nr:hypothetical protein [Thermoanaerobaculia bacterium]
MIILAAGCLAALAIPMVQVPLVAVAFVGYVACGRRAMVLWQVDEKVFDHGRRRPAASNASRARLVAAAGFLSAMAATTRAQQTIFNVPSADVLDPGKVYAEVDELFRPTEPKFSSTTVRGVYGVLPGMEAGVNFGGFSSPGSTIPTATLAVKIQPVHAGGFTLTAGGYGLFYLRGSEDGNPAGMGYGFASYRIAGTETRIDVGGWYSSAGFAKPSSTGGALVTFEQPLPFVKGLTLAADWYSGVNSIGYFSPGFIYGFGPWTAYAAYTMKNGNSKGNGGLIELGYSF